MKRPLAIVGTLAVTAGLLAGTMVAPFVGASSHREAPAIADDPPADITDLYAFRSPDAPDTVTLIMNTWPFEEPMGGPNYFKFDENVRYEINISNDGGVNRDVVYRVEFRTEIQNPNTFLYNFGPFQRTTDPNLNVRQFATLTRLAGGGEMVLGTDLPVQPVSIGPRSNPPMEGDAVGVSGRPEVSELANGEGMFYAGQRGDPFYVDLGIFDLLALRNPGVNSLAGYNVQSIALQVPINRLTSDGNGVSSASASNAVIGVWATTSRQQRRVLSESGFGLNTEGSFVQISRLGNPLVNEVVVPLQFKDTFNGTEPAGDAAFLPKVQDPELPKLLKALYGIDAPPAPRDDLVTIFLKGIPGVNQPENVTPSEMLRLNMGIAPTAGAVGEGNRMGVLANDAGGYPNGRRLEDDVVDIAMQAMAGATPLTPDFNTAPNNTLGDSVNRSDQTFNSLFPYLSAPHVGWDHRHHQ